jgi:hypothetical protein
MASSGERSVEGGFDIGRGGLGSFDLAISLSEGTGQPLHLGGEEILGNGSGVVGA